MKIITKYLDPKEINNIMKFDVVLGGNRYQISSNSGELRIRAVGDNGLSITPVTANVIEVNQVK